MDDVFSTFMCKDFLSYEYNEKKCCVVSKSDQPKFEYDDTTWENIIKHKMAEYKWLESETPRARKAKKVRVPQKTRRNLFKARKGKKNRSKLSAALLPSSSTSQTQRSPKTSNVRESKGKSRCSSVTPKHEKFLPSATHTTKMRVPKLRRCLFEVSSRKRKRASPLKTSPIKRKPAAKTPTSCSNHVLSSEDPANSILSFTNSISADSNSLLKEDHKTPLLNLTNRRQNTKRKRNIKKCDGSKFRKMLKDLSVNADEHSENESCLYSVSNNNSPNLICRGTFHQGCHDSFHYPGQQCSAIALAAIFYSTIKSVDTWKSTNVDEILLLGDKIHFYQVCHLKKDPNGDQKLTLDEVPNGLTMLNYTFSNEGREIVAGSLKKEDDPDNDFPTLEEALRKCQGATGMVLRVLDYCVGCIKESSSWCLVDSHARNSEGFIDENGTAVVLKFKSLSELANYVRRFVEKQTTLPRDADLSFEALIVKVRKVQNEDSNVSIVPTMKLFSWASSHGQCEIFSTSLCRLEEGKKLDDNTVDFYILHSIKSLVEEDKRDDLHVFNSCFYAKIEKNLNPQTTRHWTKRTNIFEKNFVILPVCYNDHWILIVIKVVFPEVSMTILDSANAERIPRVHVERTVKRYLEEEWCAKYSSQQDLVFKGSRYPVVPQQTNNVDCGVYLLKNFTDFLKSYPITELAWASWRPDYAEEDVVELRREIRFLIQRLSCQSK